MEGKKGVKKGTWSQEEDRLLKICVKKFGEGNWSLVSERAGLRRCRKSCRLRWLNYLKPNIKRGEFMEDEIDLIIRLHNLLGNRWSLIARRIPDRTANDIKNYWNTHLSRKLCSDKELRMVGNKVMKTEKDIGNKNTKQMMNNICSTTNGSIVDGKKNKGKQPVNFTTNKTIIKAIKPKAWVWKPCQPQSLQHKHPMCVETFGQGNNLGITTKIGETKASTVVASSDIWCSSIGSTTIKEMSPASTTNWEKNDRVEAKLSFWAKVLSEDNDSGGILVNGESNNHHMEKEELSSSSCVYKQQATTRDSLGDDITTHGSLTEWDDYFLDEDIKRFLGPDV